MKKWLIAGLLIISTLSCKESSVESRKTGEQGGVQASAELVLQQVDGAELQLSNLSIASNSEGNGICRFEAQELGTNEDYLRYQLCKDSSCSQTNEGTLDLGDSILPFFSPEFTHIRVQRCASKERAKNTTQDICGSFVPALALPNLNQCFSHQGGKDLIENEKKFIRQLREEGEGLFASLQTYLQSKEAERNECQALLEEQTGVKRAALALFTAASSRELSAVMTRGRFMRALQAPRESAPGLGLVGGEVVPMSTFGAIRVPSDDLKGQSLKEWIAAEYRAGNPAVVSAVEKMSTSRNPSVIQRQIPYMQDGQLLQVSEGIRAEAQRLETQARQQQPEQVAEQKPLAQDASEPSKQISDTDSEPPTTRQASGTFSEPETEAAAEPKVEEWESKFAEVKKIQVEVETKVRTIPPVSRLNRGAPTHFRDPTIFNIDDLEEATSSSRTVISEPSRVNPVDLKYREAKVEIVGTLFKNPELRRKIPKKALKTNAKGVQELDVKIVEDMDLKELKLEPDDLRILKADLSKQLKSNQLEALSTTAGKINEQRLRNLDEVAVRKGLAYSVVSETLGEEVFMRQQQKGTLTPEVVRQREAMMDNVRDLHKKLGALDKTDFDSLRSQLRGAVVDDIAVRSADAGFRRVGDIDANFKVKFSLSSSGRAGLTSCPETVALIDRIAASELQAAKIRLQRVDNEQAYAKRKAEK